MMQKSSFLVGLPVVALLMVSSMSLVGCQSNETDITSRSIRATIADEYEGLVMTKEDRDNQRFAAWNLNMRTIHDDLDHIFFDDRAMRLSIHPMP